MQDDRDAPGLSGMWHSIALTYICRNERFLFAILSDAGVYAKLNVMTRCNWKEEVKLILGSKGLYSELVLISVLFCLITCVWFSHFQAGS